MKESTSCCCDFKFRAVFFCFSLSRATPFLLLLVSLQYQPYFEYFFSATSLKWLLATTKEVTLEHFIMSAPSFLLLFSIHLLNIYFAIPIMFEYNFSFFLTKTYQEHYAGERDGARLVLENQLHQKLAQFLSQVL